MKKIYLLAIAAFAFAFTGQAQDLEDDFDFYTLGDISPQAFHFRTWGGGGLDPIDGQVVDTQSSSGDQSLYIEANPALDVIMLVDAQPDSGVYQLRWNMLVTDGNTAYFNAQGETTPDGTDWNQALFGGNVYFNCANDGVGFVTGGTDCAAEPVATFNHPVDEWFDIVCSYDWDARTWSMHINGELQFEDYEFAFGADPALYLGGINFYSAEANNDYYIDDVAMGTDLLSTVSFEETGFRSALSNDILTLKANEAISHVEIFNMLGQSVYSSSKNTSEINMSSFANGTYIVKVNISGTEGTVKIVK